MTTLTGTITDGIGSNDAQRIAYGVAVTESAHLPDLLAAIRGFPKTITDGIGINDVVVKQLGVIVAELLQLQQTESMNQLSHLSLVDSIFAHDAIARGVPLTITDGIGMALVQAAQQVISIIESLGLRDIVSPIFKYGVPVAEQLQFVDVILRFIGAAISEHIQLVDELTGLGQMYASITDGLGLLTDLSSTRLVLSATIQDGVHITDTELVKAIFRGVIQDGIQVAAGYFEPNGSVTTWAMNTRTHAVTEYTNYSFNSFARMGDRYLGATKDGLYDLSGDTDNGTDIIADIKSGFAQFAGVHLSSFKGAYIAARGGGSYVLRIYTGTGQEYHFSVATDSMKTARVDMGKGIRARYFAFELISAGQDFDLDSLEFIPLIAKRRV